LSSALTYATNARMSTLVLLALLFFSPQGGGIKGKVVADIPDHRRALPGVEFTGTGVLDRAQNEFSAFLQDKWVTNKRVVVDLGLLAWNLQVDHDVNRHLLLRLGYEDRSTRRDFTLEPIVKASTANEGLLFLQNSGRSRYRELQAVARFRFQESRNIYLSYVRSAARGNLNDFNTYFGNQKHPVLRPDEYGKQPYDVPNRLLFWGDFGLPFDIVATPVFDWHSGFPFSPLNEQQDFVGPRNEGGRFPQLMTLDLLVTKGLSIPFRGKKYKGRAGMTIFNITNHWNPRDVQNNINAPQFGTFFNSAERSVRLKFEFVKY
jgi:hypothetical protein